MHADRQVAVPEDTAALRFSRAAARELGALRAEAEAFFHVEAELLDTRRYRDWLGLLHPDIRYTVPLRRSVKFGEYEREFTDDARLDSMWFSDDLVTLEQRVRQLETGIHWAEEPASRLCHLVTNVTVLGADRAGDGTVTQVRTSCRFLVYRNRLEAETDILAGRRLDTLAAEADTFRVLRREVQLAQSVLQAKNLTFFF